MSATRRALPRDVFDDLVRTLLERYGEEWIGDARQNAAFARVATSVVQTAEGMHLISEPDLKQTSLDFDVWIEHPVEDVWETDELAFAVFAEISEDIFLASRQIEERGVRYRFLTGSMENGHLGSLHFTGPHAMAFVNVYRLRSIKGQQFHA